MNVRPRLSRRELLALSALPPVALCGWALRDVVLRRNSANPDSTDIDGAPLTVPDDPEIHRLQRLAAAIEPLFSKRAPPKPDEWLAQHDELGQTFAQFLGGRPEKLWERY